MEGQWNDLANAIVEQAVRDWIGANNYIETHDETRNQWTRDRVRAARKMKAECEEFFLSGRITQFTNLDGALILKVLKEEASEHKGENSRFGFYV